MRKPYWLQRAGHRARVAPAYGVAGVRLVALRPKDNDHGAKAVHVFRGTGETLC